MNYKFITTTNEIRQRACTAIMQAEGEHEVIIRPHKSKRNSQQNRRMWAMLGDISKQVEWYGKKLTPENWKDMVTAALKKQEVVPGIDNGFVVLGTSTSKMTVAQMSEVIEFMFAFGAEHKVIWTDPTLPENFC